MAISTTRTVVGATEPAPLLPMTIDVLNGYEPLAHILTDALNQAQMGKGAQRHGSGLPFHKQPMQQLIKLHGLGFATGQASKKSQEALRMDKDAAIRELLGAIVYTAGAILALQMGDEQ